MKQSSFADNIDADEINKFSKLASSWWDTTGKFKPLHQINPLRLNYINQHINLVNKTVLDVGCGGGILTESMSFRGAKVTGIDASFDVINAAKVHAKQSKLTVEYLHTTVENLLIQQPRQFDAITCLEMLEHVPNPQSVIDACFQLLKPGGLIFFSTINRNLISYFGAIVAAEHLLKMLPKGTHQYSKFIKPSELCGYMRSSGFEVMETIGMTYNPITQSYSLNQNNISINYIIRGRKM
jgi:2-polyprenyl-6-hydroxyphenyl methylase/3-demethylubiquinone-9 3-methyltransferase